MSSSVPLAPLQTLPLSCVRTARQTARPAWTLVITATAAPKAAINFSYMRESAGPIAQSKLAKIINKHSDVNSVIMFPPSYLVKPLLTSPSEVYMRQQRAHVKPVIAPV